MLVFALSPYGPRLVTCVTRLVSACRNPSAVIRTTGLCDMAHNPPGGAKGWLCHEFRGILWQRARSPADGEFVHPMALKESNLEIRTASSAELEQKHRRRMLTALAVLLTALIVVIIRDRQFWFPASPEPVAIDQAPSPASPVAAPQTETAPPAGTSLQPTVPSKTRHAPGKHSPAAAAPAPSDSPAVVPPMVATTSRAVLPPLEVEVVAGNQHRTLTPGSNSVKVDMQSSVPGGASPAAPAQAHEVPNANAQVSMSAPTAARVSRTVSPSYPQLAKQMKVQGAVVLQALIDKTGNIEDLHVVSGPAILSAAAQEAVKQWHFKPYYQGGQPVETEARITVNFTISTY